jgi:hypothetical protein
MNAPPDSGQSDQAADEALKESWFVQWGDVPHPHHRLLRRLRHPLSTVDQADQANDQSECASVQVA